MPIVNVYSDSGGSEREFTNTVEKTLYLSRWLEV